MTISKKNSRTININGELFRWVISPDSGFVVFVAEHEEIKGQRIEVYINSDIDDFWVDFPHVESSNLRIVKPKLARTIIIQAIEDGWSYKEAGKPLVFDLKGDHLVRRHN